MYIWNLLKLKIAVATYVTNKVSVNYDPKR